VLFARIQRIVNAIEEATNGNLSQIASRVHRQKIHASGKADLVRELLQSASGEFQLSETVALNQEAGPEETDDALS
jgi:hypothetical protein